MTDEKKAARQGGPCQNADSHSSNIAAPCNAPFDSIADTIRGQADAQRFVLALRDGIASPDALLMRLRELVTSPAATRGFCRTLQKFIERGAF